MPTRIYPLTFAHHEDLGDAAGVVAMLTAGLELVRIVRVGFLGKSTRLRFWRLHQSLDLKDYDYTDIAEGDIVQSQSLKSEG